MKTVTKSQMTQNRVIKKNQKERKKILKKICEKFNIILNKSQVFYSYQEEFLLKELEKGRVLDNIQKDRIIIDESIIFDHKQDKYLNQNNSSRKPEGIVETPDSVPFSHIAPPIDFGAAVLSIESSNSDYLCSDQSECQNNTDSEIENRICQQVSESMYLQWDQVYSEFFQQFRSCYEKHMKQVKNILCAIEELSQINRRCCKNNALSLVVVNQLPSESKQKVEFPKLDQIDSIQQLSKQKIPSQMKQNWISPSFQNSHQSGGCENINMDANIRQQKSLTVIPTHFIKQDLSFRLSSNLNDSSNEQCLSGSNYLPQTKIEKVSIHQLQDSELFFYKSQNNYMKKSWSVFQCNNQQEHLKQLLFQPQVNQPNQSVIEEKYKVNLTKFFYHNQANSQKNRFNIQQLETLMIKPGPYEEVLNSSHSQRWASEAEEEKTSHQYEEEMRSIIKRKRMYLGCPFLVNVRSRKK